MLGVAAFGFLISSFDSLTLTPSKSCSLPELVDFSVWFFSHFGKQQIGSTRFFQSTWSEVSCWVPEVAHEVLGRTVCQVGPRNSLFDGVSEDDG